MLANVFPFQGEDSIPRRQGQKEEQFYNAAQAQLGSVQSIRVRFPYSETADRLQGPKGSNSTPGP